MAKKPGPKKGSKQRPRSSAQKKSATAAKESPTRERTQARSSETRQKEQPTSSRLSTLANSRGVRGALAATLVSAAGALLFWKRRDGSDNERSEQETDVATSRVQPTKPAGSGSGKGKGRSSLPSSGETDPLVAAGVAGRVGKKQSAAKKGRRSAKPAAAAAPGSADASDPRQDLPGAFPDGSPVGDTVGRTSIEGGTDRPE